MEKINIAHLREGHHEFTFLPDASEFDLENVDCRDLKVEVKVEKTGSQLMLDGQIRGIFITPCDRCLETFELRFDAPFRVVYKYDFTGLLKESDDDNIRFVSPKTVSIDISEFVRDYILLSVPMKAVPDEIDGVCKVCNRNIEDFLNPGIEPEINPVWEKLIKLKTKDQ